MSSQIVRDFVDSCCKEEVPELIAGYLVEVTQKIKEGNKTREQKFKGTVINVNPGAGTDSTFTVRKVTDGIGIEKVFPFHAPSIVKIDVIRAHKVRRAKLNYLRDRSGKALRMKEIPLDLKFTKHEKAPVAEAPVEESKEA